VASLLRLTADGFAALVKGDAPELAGELDPALDAVRAPRTVIDLERRGEHGTCWVGDADAWLLVPEQPGWFVAFACTLDELPVALLRAVGAAESPRPRGEVLRYGAPELAGVLARDELEGFRAHWRVGTVEVIETEAGSWSVVPDGSEVELHPVDATWIYGAIADLIAEPAHA
jgi:hypothetical protein